MRRSLTLAALIVVIALATAGTLLWITSILRPVSSVEPGDVRAEFRAGTSYEFIVDLPTDAPLDAAGATVLRTARILAAGRFPAPTPRAIAFDFRAPDALMRLVYDPGILASGAVSGGTGDHMLGLAGVGSRWPQRADTSVERYCGRMETATQPFCERVTGG